MQLDRKIGPEIKKITSLEIPPVHREILPNGTEFIEVNMGTQNLVQLEVLYRGGRMNEKKKGVSRATAMLIKEGTLSYSAAEIAEEIDFYGANISSGASLDYSYIKVFTLSKYFLNVFPILQEVLDKPTFPENELRIYKERNIQKLKVEMAKSELVAYKAITETLYGQDHPYGYNSTAEVYNDLTREDLISYYNECFGTDNRIVIISGKVTPEIRSKLIQYFGAHIKKSLPFSFPGNEGVKSGYVNRIKATDKIQSAIKIGKRLFGRDHPDYADMYILNTLLGGYFGSRLMTSLREEKGYTYNIYSSIDMMIYDGYFNISTEVGNEYLEETLIGIYEELQLLQDEKVGSQELEMVKNYLKGNFLNMIDGPFKVAGLSKVVALNKLDFDFYDNLMHRIHDISAEEIQLMARKYFRKDEMVEIIVGNT